jgi:hypothetical protein
MATASQPRQLRPASHGHGQPAGSMRPAKAAAPSQAAKAMSRQHAVASLGHVQPGQVHAVMFFF